MYMDMAVFLLSVYVLVMAVCELFIDFPPEIQRVILYIDHGICVVFLLEFMYHFFKAPNKWHYMKWGWIDLLASIPNVESLRWGRVFRMVRIIRILKAFRTFKGFSNYFFKHKVEGTFTTVALISVSMIIFSSVAILEVETMPNSNIKTAEDALWFSYATITTVGYGDKYPVTTEGRVIAAMLMTVGVGLFGTFTAWVSSWFVESKESQVSDD